MERETGVSRSAIHFYVRRGLLPPPQKTAASRALYSHDHLRLLRKIIELKAAGRSLAQIKIDLEGDLARARENVVDLAGCEHDRTHRAILRVATERFAADGYEQTRVADIIRTLGITPQVFYKHFPSKLQLLVESFHTFVSWNLAYVEPEATQSSDPGERLLRRLAADYRTSEFGADVMSRIRSEPSDDRADKLKLAERAWDGIARQIQTDFETAVPPGSPPPPIPLELLAHSMIGAQHNASARASWDQRFGRADVLRTHLWLWSAVTAALSGNTRIRNQVARYEGLIREIAAREPENPPPTAD